MYGLGTYSIVAVDEEAGQMGVAVQSHWFCVGPIVAWAKAGVGVVATQSLAEPSYGPLGLALLEGGKSPAEALRALLSVDERAELRQVAVLDRSGRVAVHTGKDCIPEAGHKAGRGYSVQANLMSSKEVWPAMAHAFEESEGPLAHRLMAALEAAERAGGDIRGRQSAAMVIVSTRATGNPATDRPLDLRVDDHPDPLGELKRLLTIHEAYEHANLGDQLLAQGRAEEAFRHYELAAQKAPHIDELFFWQGVALLNQGLIERAKEALERAFRANPSWKSVLASLPTALLRDREALRRALGRGASGSAGSK
jgi:uncharacterized Ntn-hydrolase superfamily protein